MINKLIKDHEVRTAEAHCDGPCGVYDPASARIAAEAVLSMTKKILDLTPPADGDANAMAAHTRSGGEDVHPWVPIGQLDDFPGIAIKLVAEN